MGAFLAGEAGSVLVAAARAPERPAGLGLEGLARPARSTGGVPAYPADALPGPEGVTVVRLLAGEEPTREAVRTWAAAHGLPVEEAVLDPVPAPEGVRVVAVSSATTGSGKTPLCRRVARGLHRSGVRVAAVRHPLGNLLLWDLEAVRVLRGPDDLLGPRPLEEEEEVAPVLGAGVPVVTGTDPEGVLARAAEEAGPGGVVLWDGGGSARPWVRPDIHLLVVDVLRPLPEGLAERVGEADVVVLAKGDTAPPERTEEAERLVRGWNARATVLLCDLPPAVPESAALVDRRVVVVEDWHSLVLGGLKAGAGAIAAKRFRCGVVDPRPFAVGAVATVLERHPWIGPVIPALGRTPEELVHLGASVRATPGDAVLWASPASPDGILDAEQRPIFRVYPEMMEVAGGSLGDVFRDLLPG